MGSREESAAKNEVRWREINNKVDRLAEEWHSAVMDIFCECADPECWAEFPIAPAEFERIKTETHFIVLPGHELSEVERVVSRSADYVVVAKPKAAVQAAERDRR